MKKFFLLTLLLMNISAFAAEDLLQFHHPQNEARYKSLITQIRCLVCQGENIADSNAMLATDLRKKVFMLVEKNYSDIEIKNYLVRRYGDTILYQPPFKNTTVLLWTFPFMALVIFLIYILSRLKHRKPLDYPSGHC